LVKIMKPGLAIFFLIGLIGALFGAISPASAHGVKVNHQPVEAIALQAKYDTGEPMAEAQVIVYAPDNPQEPWLTGVTDTEGKFTFTPAGDRPGNWEVMVRQAGHGAMVTVPWENTVADNVQEELATVDNTEVSTTSSNIALASTESQSPTENLSPAQRGITMGAIIWGFVGTALFFSKGRSQGRA